MISSFSRLYWPGGELPYCLHNFSQTVELNPLSFNDGHRAEATLPRHLTLHLADTAHIRHLQFSHIHSIIRIFSLWQFRYRALLSFDWLWVTSVLPPLCGSSSTAALLSLRRHRVWALKPSPQVALHGVLLTTISTATSSTFSNLAALKIWSRRQRKRGRPRPPNVLCITKFCLDINLLVNLPVFQRLGIL